ncbi:MAG: hypothetical protein V8S95_12130 [Odoribacter sp.]
MKNRGVDGKYANILMDTPCKIIPDLVKSIFYISNLCLMKLRVLQLQCRFRSVSSMAGMWFERGFKRYFPVSFCREALT